jgi:Cof subfamily protein (haloacid dehalogenase superfamily)
MCPVRPRAVASDLDGTLLRSDGTVDPRSRHALAAAEAAGALVVLCTARPTRWMRPLARELGHHGVAICANGAVLWDLHTESVLESFPLQPAIAAELVASLKAAIPDCAWAVERTAGFAREQRYVSRWPVPEGTTVGVVEALIAEPAVKLMLRHDRLLADELLQRARAAVGDLAELTHSNAGDGLLEISASGVSKASTLARLCAERGIAADDVIAFGDMPNDLAMLRWAGRAVAVANAHPDVLSMADEVTRGNDEAGVAIVLDRLFGEDLGPIAPTNSAPQATR